MNYPSRLPLAHQRFLERLLQRITPDPRFIGLAATGSYVNNQMDPYSDLDLILGIADADYAQVMAQREQILAELGHCVRAFSGEHVGVPSLMICLFGPDLIHVDINFLALQTPYQVGAHTTLWQRHPHFAQILQGKQQPAPALDPNWIEDRFWVWVHYLASKIGRGEYFEALDFLSFLRAQVLGPMALSLHKQPAYGVRRLEQWAPDWAAKLRATISTGEALDLIRATRACVQIYGELKAEWGGVRAYPEAERAALDYLQQREADLLGRA
ncbi:MAG: oxalate:formate antiporter [Candidatus Sericytochromatia bacterium]